LGREDSSGVTGVQLFRLMFFLVLPVACGALALVEQRRPVPLGGWKGRTLLYGPLIGVALSFVVFAAVIVASVLAGH
jgi:hypothetical protein